MMFYAIFAASLLAPRNRRGFIVAIALALIVLLGAFVLPDTKWTYLYTSSVLFEFVYGMAIAEAYRRGFIQKISPLLAWLIFGLGVVAITFTAPNAPLRGVLVGIPATAIFIGLLALNKKIESRPIKGLKLLGDASYSIYLTHLIVLSAAFQMWRIVGLPTQVNSFWVFTAYATALCVSIGVLVYKFVEIPLTEYFQKKIA